MKSYKVMVHPNNKQKTKMFQYANGARYAYDWAIEQEKNAYENKEKFISTFDLHHRFVEFKKQEGNEWLNQCNAEAMNCSIIDAITAFKRFFKKLSDYPQFKSRKRNKP